MLDVCPCDNSVLCTLPLSPYPLLPLSYSYSKTPNFLKMMDFLPTPFFFSLPWILLTPNAVDVGLDLLFHLPPVPIISLILTGRFLPSISDWLSQKAGHSSPVGRESHAAFGRVALFLIYIPQQVTTLGVLVMLMNYKVPRLLRS